MQRDARRRGRRMLGAIAAGVMVFTISSGPASAATPRVPGCFGADTTVGAKSGVNGQLRSSLARDSEAVFGAGISFGDVVQLHQAGSLGGTCGS